MSATAEQVRAALRELAEPSEVGEHIETAIRRAALAAGMSYSRAWSFWYRKVRRVDHHEVVAVQNALAKRRAARNDRDISIADAPTIAARLAEMEREIAYLRFQISRLDVPAHGPIPARPYGAASRAGHAEWREGDALDIEGA